MKKRSKNYRNIWKKHNGRKIPKGYHIHHVDGDRTNDSPDNLICVSSEEHLRLHEAMGDRLVGGKFLLKAGNCLGRKRTEDEKRKISEAKKGINTYFPNENTKIKMSKAHGGKPFVIKTKSGKIIGRWINISQCASDLSLNRGNLSSCLHGRQRTVGEYLAEFV